MRGSTAACIQVSTTADVSSSLSNCGEHSKELRMVQGQGIFLLSEKEKKNLLHTAATVCGWAVI